MTFLPFFLVTLPVTLMTFYTIYLMPFPNLSCRNFVGFWVISCLYFFFTVGFLAPSTSLLTFPRHVVSLLRMALKKWDPRRNDGSQAERIIRRFGGPSRLLTVLRELGEESRHLVTIYRWLHARDKGGTGGHIPHAMVPVIQRAALWEGIVLRPEDWEPGVKTLVERPHPPTSRP